MTDIKKFSFSALEILPGARWQRGGQGKRIHWSLEDPAAAIGTIEERLAVFRRVRDDIKARTEEFLNSPATLPSPARRLCRNYYFVTLNLFQGLITI